MKKRFFSFLCAVILFCSILPLSYAEEETEGEEGPAGPYIGSSAAPEASPAPEISATPETIAHVGLFYGSGVMDGINLENSVGVGYRLGYMDESRTFQSLGYLEESTISVIKDSNVWYGTSDGYACYFDSILSDIGIGCWHVLIPAEVFSFEEAQAFVAGTGAEEYFPAWVNGEWQVRYGAYADRAAAQGAADTMGGVVVEPGGYGVSVVRRGTSRILFQFDGGSYRSLTLAPGLDNSVRSVTWMKGNKYYGMFQFRRLTAGGDLTISNFLPLDDYAECVTSREMSASWPMEALKAQVVCARNFYEQMLADHKHQSQGFDICNTTHCQVYFGMASTNERTAQAAAETSELRIWYQGERAEIFYYGSNGGATEACQNVWVREYPYLVGKMDPYEPTVADKIYHYNWTVTYTAQEIAERLRSKGFDCSDIVDYQITARTEMGNVRAIAFIDANGKSWPFFKDDVRTFLGLRSMRYTVTSSHAPVTNSYTVNEGDMLTSVSGAYVIGADGTLTQIFNHPYVITSSGVDQLSGAVAPNTPTASSQEELVFTIKGTGTGHHVGMSQWGAYAMAQQGFTFEEIIQFYFPGVEIY